MKRPVRLVLVLVLAIVVGGLGILRLVFWHQKQVRRSIELARDRCHAAVSRSLIERFKATAPEFIVADIRFDQTADWTVTAVGIAAFSDVDRKESLHDYQCCLSRTTSQPDNGRR